MINWEKKFKRVSKKCERLSKHCEELEFEIYELNSKLGVKLDCIGVKPGKGKISLP